MVDSVWQARLYTLLCDLTGENGIVVGGGEPCTLYTRFCRSPLGAVAAAYLMEQFESMGLETEYDYVGLVLGVKAVLFPFGDSRGWAVGKQGAIVYTEDGGGLWTEQAYREGPDPDEVITYRDIWMLGENTGILIGNYGTILRTVDGTAWDPITSPTGEDLRKVFFTDSLVGYKRVDTGPPRV